jgi:hypothetical protein
MTFDASVRTVLAFMTATYWAGASWSLSKAARDIPGRPGVSAALPFNLKREGKRQAIVEY